MLIVASVRFPNVKWGLIDRMLVAAQSGRLKPILCINKIDLIDEAETSGDRVDPRAAIAHYQSMGIALLSTSATNGIGLDELRTTLAGNETVLAGHSGVGKSSLINSIQPQLDLRIGDISRFNDKGRHTTTSARRYPLDFGGAVIDTPGVKLFGLWGVTSDNLLEYFPDVAAGTAPTWRAESYQRIATSLS
jgi:ribosome biogenesis GTPase / thiamine phosphate phosphatase